MAIIRDQPSGRPSPASDRKVSSAGQGRPIYEKEARSPKGRKAVYVEALTQARLTQAAAELGMNMNDMAEAAMREYLSREAAALFEREFAAADQRSAISIQRWEFERQWKSPAWSRE